MEEIEIKEQYESIDINDDGLNSTEQLPSTTNCDNIEPLIQVLRHQKVLKEKSQILQPNTVHQYNKNMGGVDQYITVAYLKRGTNSKKGIGRPLMTSSRSNVIDSVRLDRKDHVIGKSRRCQFQKCKGRPLTFCTKCNVTLCLKCFPMYHT
ncbi:UNVERIFIED_CONTAM: hypothetical protein NCL1_61647 [Trichonephila clavipes]